MDRGPGSGAQRYHVSHSSMYRLSHCSCMKDWKSPTFTSQHEFNIPLAVSDLQHDHNSRAATRRSTFHLRPFEALDRALDHSRAAILGAYPLTSSLLRRDSTEQAGGFTVSNAVSRSFTRENLGSARIVGQVDCKFIACLVDSPPPTDSDQSPILIDETHTSRSNIPRAPAPVLILVDQHAADERVRVEHFLTQICDGFIQDKVEQRPLQASSNSSGTQPSGKRILLSITEARILLGKHLNTIRGAFKRWGFTFNDLRYGAAEGGNDENDAQFTQVEVLTVPEVIADKVGEHAMDRYAILTLMCNIINSWRRPTSYRM